MTEQHQPPSDLRMRAVVPGPPKIVWEALTDPAALRVWLAKHADTRVTAKTATATPAQMPPGQAT